MNGFRYVLIAGSGARDGGGTVSAFSDEAVARRAFLKQRLEDTTADAWARLAAVEPSGRSRVICWFGPVRATSSGSPAAEGAGHRRRTGFRRRLATR